MVLMYTAPQPEREGAQPSHSTAKSRADTQGAMHSLQGSFGVLSNVQTVKRLCFNFYRIDPTWEPVISSDSTYIVQVYKFCGFYLLWVYTCPITLYLWLSVCLRVSERGRERVAGWWMRAVLWRKFNGWKLSTVSRHQFGLGRKSLAVSTVLQFCWEAEAARNLTERKT